MKHDRSSEHADTVRILAALGVPGGALSQRQAERTVARLMLRFPFPEGFEATGREIRGGGCARYVDEGHRTSTAASDRVA